MENNVERYKRGCSRDCDEVNYFNSQAAERSRDHVPVMPDMAQTVKVGSDHSENLTNVFDGAKNGIFSQKFFTVLT